MTAMLNADLVASCRESFAASYFEARERFLALAGETSRYPCEARGPGGEPLSTDVAWFGDPDAPRVCVAISAVHGAEGYCGSGVQVDWQAHAGLDRLPDGTAVMLIHALNPYGFAWDRRVTEEGCDLNRNFVDFSLGTPSNPHYAELADVLVPPDLSEPSIQAAERTIADFRLKHGEFVFQRARKGGQYTHPKGMFFGGFSPTSARRRLERIAGDYRLAERQFITIIDVHTGLGPFGYGEPQSEHDPKSRSHALARRMFGQSVTSTDLGTSFSIPVTGTVLSFWENLLGDGRYVYLCLEFGTYDQEESRRVLRQDHWLFAHGGADPTIEPGRRIRAELKRQYYPGTGDWQEMVLFRGRQILRQALAGM